ncbi:hypothetical protein Tco_0527941 [Tanacetum coccineum]
MNELPVRLNILRLTISPEACSFMLCDLDFEPLSLSLSSLPSCDLMLWAVRVDIFFSIIGLEFEAEKRGHFMVTFRVLLDGGISFRGLAMAGRLIKRVALWHDIYDTQRENHDLRMQIAKERR